MRRNDDAALAIAIAGSISAGVALPTAGLIVDPYLLAWLGALLFLNLLRLNPKDLVATFSRPKSLAVLSAVKLVGVPLAMYGATYVLYKPFALPVLLLSGISTGLGAPFVVNLIGGRLPLVVGMITMTSLAVPFVLPGLVKALEGSDFHVPIGEMVLLLAVALFVPLAAGWLAKKFVPSASAFADKHSFPLSIIFIVLINFGMFARFSGYFYDSQVFVLQTIATAFLCFGAYCLLGYFTSPTKQDRTAGLISMAYINNVLVAVFALQFFGAQVAALAAFYNIPYYVGIIPIKKIALRLAHS